MSSEVETSLIISLARNAEQNQGFLDSARNDNGLAPPLQVRT